MPAAATLASWPQFAAWVGCGAGVGAVLAGTFTFGPLGLLAAACFAAVAVRLGGTNSSLIGAAAGAGVWPLVIGFLNIDGPGTSCHTTGGGQTCTEEWSPWPFWAVGIALLILAPVVFEVSRRRRAATFHVTHDRP